MKDDDQILTLEEAERLCRLYRDCLLSPLEEAELRYVLPHTPFDTPLIAETRAFMDVESRLSYRPTSIKRQKSYKRLFISIAASLLVCLGAGYVYLMLTAPRERDESLLALHQNDTIIPETPIKTVEETTPVMVTEPKDEPLVASSHRKKRIPQSLNESSRQSPGVARTQEQHDGYTEINDDEEIKNVIEDIHARLAKFVDISVEIQENLSDLNNVEKKIIEKI